MFDYHALFEFIGIIATGYIIARLVLRIPIVKKFLIYSGKKSIDRTDNPNPVIEADNLKISENVVSDSYPVKDFNESKDNPLDNNPLNMPSSPISEKSDYSANHGKRIISKSIERNN